MSRWNLYFAVAAGALVACGGPTPTPTTPEPAAPTASVSPEPVAPRVGHGVRGIPHAIAGKEDCVSCHRVGQGHSAMPTDHEGRDNASCTTCHKER